MPIRFEGPAVLVSDIRRSRRFYEDVLMQEALADFGQNIPFKAGFSLWKDDHATEIMFAGNGPVPSPLANGNFEMYFESDDLNADWARIEKLWPDVIHPIVEAPWAQRGFRVRDPDGHVVEVAESLPAVFRRLLDEGLTPEEVSQRTTVPLEMVLNMTRK